MTSLRRFGSCVAWSLLFILLLAVLILSAFPVIVQLCLPSSHWIWSYLYYKLHEYAITHGSLIVIDKTESNYNTNTNTDTNTDTNCHQNMDSVYYFGAGHNIHNIHNNQCQDDDNHYDGGKNHQNDACAVYLSTMHDHYDYGYEYEDQDDCVCITVHNISHFRRVLLQSDVGLGESFVLQEWSSNNITKYLKLMATNYYYFYIKEEVNVDYYSSSGAVYHVLKRLLSMYTRYSSFFYWKEFWDLFAIRNLNRNAANDQRFIESHYDKGMALFAQFLDPSMTYTNAMFPDLMPGAVVYDDADYDRYEHYAHAKQENANLFSGFAAAKRVYRNLNFVPKQNSSDSRHTLVLNPADADAYEHELENEELYNAQLNKVRHLVSKSNLMNIIQHHNSDDDDDDTAVNVLDIGCGFGFLSGYVFKNMVAAAAANDKHNYGNVNVSEIYGITLSTDQYQYSQQKYSSFTSGATMKKDADSDADSVSESDSASHHSVGGSSIALKFALSDYRLFLNNSAMHNHFDAIFSIEMIEAIGFSEIETFFKLVSRALKPRARLVIQFLAYPEWFFPGFSASSSIPTFVVKHIFPGGFIPNEGNIHSIAWKYKLKLLHTEKIGRNYVRTLNIWANNLRRKKEQIMAAFDLDTYLAFEYYLRWCQALFEIEMLNNIQMVFEKS